MHSAPLIPSPFQGRGVGVGAHVRAPKDSSATASQGLRAPSSLPHPYTPPLKGRGLVFLALLFVVSLLLLAAPAFAQTQPTGGIDRALNTISGDGRPLSLSLQILLLM